MLKSFVELPAMFYQTTITRHSNHDAVAMHHRKVKQLRRKQTDGRREGGRERTVHSLCWHNPSHFSHNAAWKTHFQSLLTTCKCYCHIINCRQQLSNKMITTCRALLQALLIYTEAESKSTHLSLKTCVYSMTPLCVCVCLHYKQDFLLC